MASATDRANIGYDQARMEGKGPVGGAVDAARAAAARGGPATGVDYPASGMANRGTDYNGMRDGVDNGTARHEGGMLGRTEEELARLRNRTVVTGESEPYAPNPNIRDLPKEFETRMQVIQRYPEMKTVEKTDLVKEVRNEERVVTVPKTRVIMDEVESVDRIPVVRQVPKTRIEQVHRVVTEDREVTDMVPLVEYEEVPRIEQVPRVITENIEERVTVPVVVEVPVTRMVEVPTGNYCEAPVEEFVNPGASHGLMQRRGVEEVVNQGAAHDFTPRRGVEEVNPGAAHDVMPPRGLDRTENDILSDDDVADGADANYINADGTTTAADPAAKPRRKRGLLNKILHH